MSRQEREREAFISALRKAIRDQNLDRLRLEEARVEPHVAVIMNDYRNFPCVLSSTRDNIFSETFAAIKMMGAVTDANKTGRRPVAA